MYMKNADIIHLVYIFIVFMKIININAQWIAEKYSI